ncbi:trichohyalin isoform X6 [Frankliniella occidentalis]|uniref:Trichohyalin isoform X6 n=1 Tax=Frankliniella occidentalis TaxID=133901 RepID=A0A9C6TYY1_FRAOC|nr:trichohyalin isoform X6 [Frankliniella occidentalis]
MHHLYPTTKGDPLCPLGFHPQVRWPTRCKRCFRDYKEHGNRNKEQDVTASSPSLSSWSSTSSRLRDDGRGDSGISSSSSGLRSGSSSSSSSNAVQDSRTSSSSATSSNDSRFGNTSLSRPASSWTSTPDLGNLNDDNLTTTVSITLPRRRPAPPDTGQTKEKEEDNFRSTSFTVRRRTASPSLPGPTRKSSWASSSYNSTNDTNNNNQHRNSKEDSLSSSSISNQTLSGSGGLRSRPPLAPSSASSASKSTKDLSAKTSTRTKTAGIKADQKDAVTSPDVQFILQVKGSKATKTKSKAKTAQSSTPTVNNSHSSSSGEDSLNEDDDDISIAGTETTETTETTLVDRNDSDLQDQIESLKAELDAVKTRCERVEREKSDILLRRLAAMDTGPSKTAASEVLKLQQKVNEYQTRSEDLLDEKKTLSLRVKELEEELSNRPLPGANQRATDELRSKLLAAETLCEELMDENEDMKRELRDLEEEMEELQDNFREDQADEYTSLKKELEQTAKNCRILSFKLRKSERKLESLENEKAEFEKKLQDLGVGEDMTEKANRIRHLEQELALSNEVSARLQRELEDTNNRLKAREDSKDEPKRKAPMLGSLPKVPSGEKVSRETLTRGGSQDDPAQLLRDLQDSVEREADLREQLKFAEEEGQILRKKVSRVEDDNESLVLQLKKMATKARISFFSSTTSSYFSECNTKQDARRHSPTPNRLTPEPPVEKDEGISDEEDPAELRLLLELNEQEAAVLRRKVEDLESEGDKLKRKVKELQDKLTAKNSRKGSASSLSSLNENSSSSGLSSLHEKKIKVLEEETSELRKKLIEKEREAERLNAELSVSQKKGKGTLAKTKSLEGPTEQQAIDLKRQLQVIENEAMVLRQRTQTLEAENDKLNSENKRLQLTRNAKNARDSSSSAAELRVLKDKVTSLESELSSANQKVRDLEGEIIKEGSKKASLKNDELDKMKVQITKISKENEKLSETLKRLKDDAASNLSEFYKARAPKKPTDATTKLQMKRMVEELESEIGEMIVALRISEENKTKLKGADALNELKEAKIKVEKELADIRNKLDQKERELEGSKAAAAEAKRKFEEEVLRSSKDFKKKEEEKNKLEKEKDKIKEENEKLRKEKKDVEDQLSKLLTEKKAASSSAQGEMSALAQRLEAVTRQYEEEKKQASAFKKQLDVAQRAEQEKSKLQKEMIEKSKQLSDIEQKLKESEEKLKKSEGLLTSRKEKISKLEKELESERKGATDSANKLKAEMEELKDARGKLQTAEIALEDTRKQLAVKTVQMEQLEASLKEERERATDATVKAGSAVAREVSALREELAESKTNLQNLKEELEEAEKSKKASEEKLKVIENQLVKEKREIEQRVTDLEVELQTEKKKSDRSRLNNEKELKSKETELNTLRSKVKTLENNTAPAKVTESLQQQVLALQQELSSEKQEYEDLTAKYELLEEEHVVTKSQLVTEKQSLERQLETLDTELGAVQSQLRTLQDTYTSKQDAWIKEKLDMEEQMKEIVEKSKRGNADTWQLERQKLMAICDEKTSELEQLKREGQGLRDQVDLMRRESEDLRRKLDDYEKVAEVQRRMTADFNEKENQLKDLKNKLLQEEKARKTEVGQLKMRYDSRVSLITEELNSLQSQVTRFKRERDTFRHMLDGAQKTISELRSNPGASKRLSSISSAEESEEARSKIATLEQQVACLEDELSESRLVASKLKTELVSERSAWEVKTSEMQSKVNELEEDRLVASGRTKIPGMKTRMELAWHKEREEQTRLLQETSTLARDLRQTLFEVERERDKERLEAKRRLDQIKKTTEEEQEENRKKVMELQCDLLELRDAHAKLRTTNEKLRREKERWDRERDDLRQLASARRRADNDEDRKIQLLLDQVEELMRLSPDMLSYRRGSSQALGTPTPPVRLKGPKSRESSPLTERKDYSREQSQSRDDSKGNMQSTLQRLIEVTDELRRYQRADSQDRDRERARRVLGIRRAASTESDTAAEVPAETRSKPSVGRGGAGLQRKGSLLRKTLSLEQTSNANEQNFWKGDDEDGSVNSLQSLDDDPRLAINRRDNSMDSRLSGGSTQSEVLHSGDKKKKKGLLGKLTKRLTKSRSVDENDPRDLSLESLHNKDGSDASLNTSEDPKGSKRDLKERLTGMFKKGSSSRSNSVEDRQPHGLPLPPHSSSRSSILERNAKPPPSESKQRSLARASPSGSDTGQTSSMSRPLAAKKTGLTGASSTTSKKSK